jgi:putative glycosyltransferase (TIGR04372 family)
MRSHPMTIVEARTGRPVLIGRPTVSTRGALSLAMAELMARSKQSGTAMCVLLPADGGDDPLLALSARDVMRITPVGMPGRLLRARWQTTAAMRAAGVRAAAASAVFWHEIHKELRRHIGDERLPYALRTRLRRIAERSLDRSARASRGAAARPPDRRLLREVVTVVMPEPLEAAGRELAHQNGIPLDRPFVALETRSRRDALHPAIDAIAGNGYTVVRVGHDDGVPIERTGVVDLTAQRSKVLSAFLLLRATFLICETADLQSVAYLTNTPCLRLNAIDPFEAYPIRRDGLFTLATPVDLHTGRELELEEGMAHSHVRHLDRYAHRPNRAVEVLAAVQEMLDVVAGVAVETVGQAQYRLRLAEAAPDQQEPGESEDRFIGDGRLARVQAERMS